jgi:glutamate synthase domain-containing protein 2
MTLPIACAVLAGALLLVALHDLLQTKHAILRNFPLIGHLRYLIEALGPEFRQYIVASNDEERPFSRDERRWVYASSKKQNNYFGFGTDNDLEATPNYLIIKQAGFTHPHALAHAAHAAPGAPLPCAKVLGGARGRAKAFRPASIIGVSAMSYGSLGKAAIEALNRGCALAGALHNTGEGGISPHHDHGGDLIWQLGTGYFGARDAAGKLCMTKLVEGVAAHAVRAIEIKLSQGAKPGKGGVLPAAKITAEISQIRAIPLGKDCLSPPVHTAFGNIDELLDLVEDIADRTGVPVGIKSAVGQLGFWHELAARMRTTGKGVDFIAIDGGEGGTGAAPLVFSDHVALPYVMGAARVYKIFAAEGLADGIVWAGAGRIGLPARAMLAFGLGCDLIMVAREAMLALGCIQAQKCHTGHCPTGVATHNRWLMRGLDPRDKAARVANYMATFRSDVLALSHACGAAHPSLVKLDSFELLQGGLEGRGAQDFFGYQPGWGLPQDSDQRAISELMDQAAQS